MTKLTATKRTSTLLLRGFLILAVLGLLAGLGVLGYFYGVVMPKVPPIDAVTDYRPKIPLRIYTADNHLIGEFGEERRSFIKIGDVPDLMKKAVLAIEDTRFYEHGGIDWVRGLGAVRANLAGGYRQGASTITMQVARNFFLTRDKKIERKVNEIALALKIEDSLSKDQILELYMNQIFMGRRSYGFGSAAQAYFGKPIDKLSIAEMAMLAGVPQDPVKINPAVNPKRSKQRQLVVLRRMFELGYISDAQYAEAKDAPIRVTEKRQDFGTHAEYVAELARQAVFEQYKEEAYTRGIKVVTTILKAEQDAAYESVRRNVLAYDQRHGYRGPEKFVTLPEDPAERSELVGDELRKRPVSDGLIPVIVVEASAKRVRVENLDGDNIDIGPSGLRLAAPGLAPSARDALRIRPGAIVRITQDAKGAWSIVQVPKVSAAFVALDTRTGGYHALVGGFDFNLQKYNHATQALRQPGSTMKPFVYAAALDKGFSPATRIADTPLDMPGENAGETWSPQNDDGKFDGEVSMRDALVHSKNVASVRILRAIGTGYAHQYITKFGFDPARHPNNLTMTLGTGAATPLQLAAGYAMFANGGFRIKPYLISTIQDGDGTLLFEYTAPLQVGADRVLDERNAFIMDSMLRDVTRRGTAAAAGAALGRQDIAGKTGTTTDAVDGWFAGYGGGVVAVAWMGYSEPRSLGGREFGATLSLPIWNDYMKVVLGRRPEVERAVPEGVIEEDGDWIYAEYAGAAEFKTIDIEGEAEDPTIDETPEAIDSAPPPETL